MGFLTLPTNWPGSLLSIARRARRSRKPCWWCTRKSGHAPCSCNCLLQTDSKRCKSLTTAACQKLVAWQCIVKVVSSFRAFAAAANALEPLQGSNKYTIVSPKLQLWTSGGIVRWFRKLVPNLLPISDNQLHSLAAPGLTKLLSTQQPSGPRIQCLEGHEKAQSPRPRNIFKPSHRGAQRTEIHKTIPGLMFDCFYLLRELSLCCQDLGKKAWRTYKPNVSSKEVAINCVNEDSTEFQNFEVIIPLEKSFQ